MNTSHFLPNLTPPPPLEGFFPDFETAQKQHKNEKKFQNKQTPFPNKQQHVQVKYTNPSWKGGEHTEV